VFLKTLTAFGGNDVSERSALEKPEQRPVRATVAARGIITGHRPLLIAEALQQRRIQIEDTRARRLPGEQPLPQRWKEARGLRLVEAIEKVAHRVVAGKSADPAKRLQRPVATQHLQMREALRTRKNAQPEREQGVLGPDRVVRTILEWQPFPLRLQKAHLAKQLDHHNQSAKGRYCPLCLSQNRLASIPNPA
jgi:hypothetical protein